MTRLAAAGIVAVFLFATIGQLSHHGHVSAGGYAADSLPFLGCWLAAAYRTRRFVPTWLAAAVGGVAIRAVVLSHYRFGELSFLAVALAFLGAVGFVVWLFAGKLPA
ncbi:MAG TPA: DUF3054 domain-containing protein [Gaiellaceae bacterium]|nr:DUF3054 domain-containing protein [Gaiellaceae bacterium]